MMYLVSEENHDALCVADSIMHGIVWLIQNDWLTLGCERVDEYGVISTLEEQIGGNPTKKDIFPWIAKIIAEDGSSMAREILEQYGLYFSEIEVA